MTDEKSKDEVYQDRNLAAIALVAVSDGPGGWTPAEEDPEEWAIVWFEPDAKTISQISWHVPRSLAELALERNDDYEWDGHTRRGKNGRLLRLAQWQDDLIEQGDEGGGDWGEEE